MIAQNSRLGLRILASLIRFCRKTCHGSQCTALAHFFRILPDLPP
jgi:hypothetical protein